MSEDPAIADCLRRKIAFRSFLPDKICVAHGAHPIKIGQVDTVAFGALKLGATLWKNHDGLIFWSFQLAHPPQAELVFEAAKAAFELILLQKKAVPYHWNCQILA